MASQTKSSGTITGTGWTNPSNASVTDAVYAIVTNSSVPADLVFSNYGFTIPVGATINGISVAVIGHGSLAGVFDMGNTVPGAGVRITKIAGTATGTTKFDNTTWNTTDSTFTEGSSADLWGTTWVPADINSTGFGVLIGLENTSGLSRTASVDSVIITVTYTPAASTSTANMIMVF